MYFEGVSFTQEQTGSLIDVSFSLYRGEIVSLAGLNTSGRKTLLDLLAWPNPNYGGRILLFPHNREFKQYRSAHEAGIFPIFSGLFRSGNMTLLENLMISPSAHLLHTVQPERITADYLAARRELECESWLPDDLNTPIESLSIGTRIIFELLKAYLQKGHLVVIFDLFPMLGEEILLRLSTLLSRIKSQGITVLCEFDEHFPAMASITDRILVTRFGCTCGELRRRPESGDFDMQTLDQMTMGRPFIDRSEIRPAPLLRQTHWEIVRLHDGARIKVSGGQIVGLCCYTECVPNDAAGFLVWLGRSCRLSYRGREQSLSQINDALEHKIAIIPRSTREIMDSLSPIENVTLYALRRLPKASLRYQKICAGLFDDVVSRYPILAPCAQYRGYRQCRHLPQEIKFKLGLARSLVLDPEIAVFLPTGENDLSLSAQFNALFAQLSAEGKAVFVCSVSRDYLEHTCDQVIDVT